MLTDSHPWLDRVPTEWLTGFRHLYPLFGHLITARQRGEKRLQQALQLVTETGQKKRHPDRAT